MWCDVVQALQLMGGEFAALSAAMKDSYDPDIMEVNPERPEDREG